MMVGHKVWFDLSVTLYQTNVLVGHLEFCGLSLATAPILHALVENWDAGMVQALIVNSLCTVGLLQY